MIFRSDQFKFQISFMFRSAWFTLLDHRAPSLPLKMALWATYWPQNSNSNMETVVVDQGVINVLFSPDSLAAFCGLRLWLKVEGMRESQEEDRCQRQPHGYLDPMHPSPISSAELMTNAEYNYKYTRKSKDQDKFIKRRHPTPWWPTFYHLKDNDKVIDKLRKRSSETTKHLC